MQTPPRSAVWRPRRHRAAVFAVLLVVALGTAAAVVAAGGAGAPVTGASGSGPNSPALATVRNAIVAAADSQVGYRTDPSDTYCNKFTSYWHAGATAGCAAGLRSEEWCADFAAWAWAKAGVAFTYGFATGDLDSAAASFWTWAVQHGTWHPVGDGYTPEPGDVAVYGLDPTSGVAVHVAVVTSPGGRGPDVVNGDGDQTGFSVVETGTDQYKADAPGGAAPLSGYASP